MRHPLLHVKTLGELKQASDAGPARPLRRKPLALVAYLARRAPRSVTRTELATLFWGERGEERARQSLRQALLELKQALGDAVEVESETVRLAPGTIELDITAFEADVAAGRLVESVGRWTGDFFEGAEDIGGDGFRRWIETERSGLHQQLGVAMERLIGDAELKGNWNEAATWSERWAATLPHDEKAHLRLIEALRMNGRSAEALKTHAAFVSRLRTALDVEPSAEFLRLGGGLADDARSELARQGRGSAAVHAPQLVGRAPILTELLDGWKRSGSGTPVVILIRGPAGSGLTRICDELAERAAAEGVVMRATGGGSSGEYATAAELFEGLRSAPGSAGAAPEALAQVARIVPSLRARFQHLPNSGGDENTLRDGLSQTLGAAADEQSLLLIVDDLHAADDASRRLIGALASRLTGRVMLVLTDDEADAPAGGTLDGLRAAKGLRRLQLEELSVADVEAMLGSMVTMEPGDRNALANRLHHDSGGLPYEIRELVTALVDDHLLQVDPSGIWRMAPTLSGRALPVPASIRDRVRSRLERMSPPARALAEAMAVLGESADAGVAGGVAGLSPDETAGGLEELAARRILREGESSPGWYEFTAPLTGRAVISLLPPTRRQALHARAAQVLLEKDLTVTAERSLLPYHLARAGKPATEPVPAAPTTGRPLRAALLGVAAVLALAVTVLVARRRPSTAAAASDVPIVALGRIADYREGATTDLTKPLTDMLATNLGRVPRLRVVSSARMYELVSQSNPDGRDTSTASLVAAARRAGATELVDGALYARDDGGFRLDLRRVELATGSIRQTYSVAGTTVFELADSSTARLAADFGEPTPTGSISDVTTRSLSAYRLYEQGLRAYYAGDLRAAEPLFEAALVEDSTFAMAAFYSALSAIDPRLLLDRFARAARLAVRTSDRERLIILARAAFMSSSPTLGALADTLVVRYPDEVEGYYYTGLSRLVEGDFLNGLEPMRRVVTMDSLALASNSPQCEACDALRQIVSLYVHTDSLAAAERETRRWIRIQPRSAYAWHLLAEVLAQQGKHAEAAQALDQSTLLDATRRGGERMVDRAILLIFAGEFEQATQLLLGEIESGGPVRSHQALWYRALGLRALGRLREARADAQRLRKIALEIFSTDLPVNRRAVPTDGLAEAQILYEMGEFRASATLFDSVSNWTVGNESASQRAHARSWALTHGTRALIAARDTVGIVQRIDTVQAIASRSGSGRDRLLHHHLRGLVLAAAGRDEEALAEYRRSMWSVSVGYTQLNMAMAESLMRLGRPGEAIAVLRPALHGSVEASNFYVPRTDIHEKLALAWARMEGPGARDSAAVHARFVVRAWSRADPIFAARLQEMKRLAGRT